MLQKRSKGQLIATYTLISHQPFGFAQIGQWWSNLLETYKSCRKYHKHAEKFVSITYSRSLYVLQVVGITQILT